jgi:putative transposase
MDRTTASAPDVQQRCELLGVPRSTYYYQPRPESVENLRLLRGLDELCLDCPCLEGRRMAVTLGVNRKRIQRLMRSLDIEALYPKPNLSRRQELPSLPVLLIFESLLARDEFHHAAFGGGNQSRED